MTMTEEREHPDPAELLHGATQTITHLTDHVLALRFSNQQLARIVALLLHDRSIANGTRPKAELSTAHIPPTFHIASEHECAADERQVPDGRRLHCVERVEYHEGEPTACPVCGPELAAAARPVPDDGLIPWHTEGLRSEGRN
jgi:hypothetical protein